jgi:hypothetical protein
MIALLTSVSSFLGGEGYGTVGTDLFAGALPDRPAVCTAVIQAGGAREFGDPTRQPSITVLHRNTMIRTGGQEITNINSTILSDNGFRCLPGEIHGRFEAESEPGLAGYDASGLLVFQVQYAFVTTEL